MSESTPTAKGDARLLESFAQVPVISKGWCLPSPDGMPPCPQNIPPQHDPPRVIG